MSKLEVVMVIFVILPLLVLLTLRLVMPHALPFSMGDAHFPGQSVLSAMVVVMAAIAVVLSVIQAQKPQPEPPENRDIRH